MSKFKVLAISGILILLLLWVAPLSCCCSSHTNSLEVVLDLRSSSDRPERVRSDFSVAAASLVAGLCGCHAHCDMEDLKLDDDDAMDAGAAPMTTPGVLQAPAVMLARQLGVRATAKGVAGVVSQTCDMANARMTDALAEERLISGRPEFEEVSCSLSLKALDDDGDMPLPAPSTKSTFLMVFSPNKELIASTHGDHNVYVSQVSNGSCIRVLQGHPRTPWCVEFHPSLNGVLASGCLGGHVRVWDIFGGGYELYRVEGAVASLAFHPTDRLLVIASFNEIHFWDWRKPEPFTWITTKSDKEKVRFVRFDPLGHQLITGIANLAPNSQIPSSSGRTATASATTREETFSSASVANALSSYDERRSRLMHRYERMMQRLGDQSSASASSPSPRQRVLVTDRGTDPMQPVASTPPATVTPAIRSLASRTLSDLAQAASSQLMAESGDSADPRAASATPNQSTGLERDDPLMSDHPYGMPSRRVSGITPLSRFITERASTDWLLPASERNRRFEASIRSARAVTEAREERYRQLRTRMFELSSRRRRERALPFGSEDLLGDESSFSHSPASEFIAVDRNHPASRASMGESGRTELVFASRDRTPESNARYRTISERRLSDLLERRRILVAQIEQLRSAREMLFPVSSSPSTSTTSTTWASGSGEGAASGTRETSSSSAHTSTWLPTRDHSYVTRPIDEWAVNQRLSLESDRLARSLVEGDQGVGGVAAGDGSSAQESAHCLGLLQSLRSLNRAIRDSMSQPDPLSSRPLSSRLDSRVLSSEDVEFAMQAVVDPREGQAAAETNATQQAAATASAAPTETNATSATATGATDQQNIDIGVLGRYVENMHRICRATLSDLSGIQQRRQVVRLQAMRRMLEDLHGHIVRLRARSVSELERRSQSLDSVLSEAAAATGTGAAETEAGLPDGAAEAGPSGSARRATSTRSTLLRARAATALRRLGASAMTRRMASSGLTRKQRTGSGQSPSARTGSPSAMALRSSTSSRARAHRAHNQLVSQLRATVHAMRLSPDLARQSNSLISKSRVEASQSVMERTSAAATSPRNELMAISQRLERMLRERREAGERVLTAPASAGEAEAAAADPSAAISDDSGLPRPVRDLDYRRRWRHLLAGTPEYDLYDDAASYLDESSSDSDSESEYRLGQQLQYAAPSGTSSSGLSRFGPGRVPMRMLRHEAQDYFYLPNPSQPPLRRLGDYPRLSSREGWRRERLDLSRELRRDADRERRRSSREWDYSRRRRFLSRLFLPDGPTDSSSLGSNDLNEASESGAASALDPLNLPPLREIIWRRLRRRNAQLNLLDEEIGVETGARERSRHREMLSWMVDQLTIDQHAQGSAARSGATGVASGGASVAARGSATAAATSNRGPGASAASARPTMPQDNGSFRHRFMGRFRDYEVFAPFQRESSFLYSNATSNGLLTQRIQAWDFFRGDIPDITDESTNVIVREAKIHNDASIDLSEDASLLVTLVPSNLPMTTVVGVYCAARGPNRGQCYATFSLESSAVSVSLSPTGRHLLVGLDARAQRNLLSPPDARTVMAQVFRIQLPWDRADKNAERGRLIPRRDIAHPLTEHGHSSLNCIRWVPVAGQGIVYGTNTGLLKILR